MVARRGDLLAGAVPFVVAAILTVALVPLIVVYWLAARWHRV
jgi:hypothetical protein